MLVDFFHGAGLTSLERYSDWDGPAPGYTSEPRMSIQIPDNEGTFTKRELRIVLPDDTFTLRAGSGVPHSPMFVRVREVTAGLFAGDQASELTLYRGRVTRTIANFQGRGGQTAFFCLSQKARIDVPMGLPCNHHCDWTVFNGFCGANPATHTIVAQIDSANGHEITVTDTQVLNKAIGDPRYWKRGYLEKGGLRIMVRDYDGAVDDEKFYMADPVPADWIGGTNDVTFVAGCDLTIGTCRSRFNAEQWFMGLGIAMLPYHPNFESQE